MLKIQQTSILIIVNVSEKHMKGGDDNVKIILYILLLFLNMVVIICQQARISELLEELQQARSDAIKEINKLRNGEK